MYLLSEGTKNRLGSTVLHIPARKGSKRVVNKNMRLLDGKPMIGYSLETAKYFDEVFDVYVNTDSKEISEYAKTFGIETYLRKPHLASDDATGDQFTYDILTELNPDTLIMINPVCPLIGVEDVINAIESYGSSSDEVDTLISVSSTNMQCVFKNEFLNVNPIGPLVPSQENEKVYTCNWAITIWNAQVFKNNFEKYQGGYCGTNRILFPLSPLKSIKVSYEDDFRLAESILMIR
jgi:CMP-N-acetylneuraminic acid synthetase